MQIYNLTLSLDIVLELITTKNIFITFAVNYKACKN